VISKEASRIRDMFNSIASKYDAANDVLSFGMHRIWKKALVRGLGSKIDIFSTLDCATGTGDIAIMLKKHFPFSEVTAIDFSEKMLEEAPAKAKKAGVEDIKFLAADILSLPFSDASFDNITISFGIRNVENLLKAISELERVLKSKGHIHILEFGQPKNPRWKKLYSTYHQSVLPVVGGVLTGNYKAYKYLNKSSEEFPSGQNFAKQFPPTTWKSKEVTPLMGGIAYIYRLQKL
jgi:demethylmenaquinone methyltransferase/2-methoxy-6-polyprenyl-1,4-benzoquinol methylase